MMMVTEHNNDDKGSRQSSEFPTACILRYYDRQTDHPWLIIILINVKGGSSGLVIVVIIIPCMFAPPILFTETHLAGAPYYNYLGKDRTLCNCCTPYSMLLLNESCNVYIAVESLRTQNTDSPGPWQLVGRII